MQIRIEIDVKPEELRRFLGLPDVAGLQEEVIQFLRDKVADAREALAEARKDLQEVKSDGDKVVETGRMSVARSINKAQDELVDIHTKVASPDSERKGAVMRNN